MSAFATGEGAGVAVGAGAGDGVVHPDSATVAIKVTSNIIYNITIDLFPGIVIPYLNIGIWYIIFVKQLIFCNLYKYTQYIIVVQQDICRPPLNAGGFLILAFSMAIAKEPYYKRSGHTYG
jgi:hypothetical protein